MSSTTLLSPAFVGLSYFSDLVGHMLTQIQLEIGEQMKVTPISKVIVQTGMRFDGEITYMANTLVMTSTHAKVSGVPAIISGGFPGATPLRLVPVLLLVLGFFRANIANTT